MPSFKAAYLIYGDDHGRVGERRARLRAMAEGVSGTGGVEVFEGDASSPEAIALALNAMTFAMGRRFLIVDGVERWKEAEIQERLVPVLAAVPPETTVAFFGREEGRGKVSTKLVDAVKKAGGDVAVEATVKPRELPRWLGREAAKLGLTLDGAAAKTLITQVGDRQQRLLRELEKLALEHGEGAHIGVDDVEAVAAPSAEHQVWGFVDALVAGNRAASTRAFLELRAQGETLPRLVPLMARRVRDVLAIAARLEAGESPAQVKGSLRMSPYAADRRIKEARATDVAAMRTALEALSELELASRGQSELGDDTEGLRAIAAITADGVPAAPARH
jgi:DNA polymerase III subunit delta